MNEHETRLSIQLLAAPVTREVLTSAQHTLSRSNLLVYWTTMPRSVEAEWDFERFASLMNLKPGIDAQPVHPGYTQLISHAGRLCLSLAMNTIVIPLPGDLKPDYEALIRRSGMLVLHVGTRAWPAGVSITAETRDAYLRAGGVHSGVIALHRPGT